MLALFQIRIRFKKQSLILLNLVVLIQISLNRALVYKRKV